MTLPYKFNEGKYIEEIQKYVDSTYLEHYAKGSNKVQTFELIDQGRDLRGLHFCTGNVLKYVDRYGEKAGYNRKDLLKAIHYLILALSSHDQAVEEGRMPIESKITVTVMSGLGGGSGGSADDQVVGRVLDE